MCVRVCVGGVGWGWGWVACQHCTKRHTEAARIQSRLIMIVHNPPPPPPPLSYLVASRQQETDSGRIYTDGSADGCPSCYFYRPLFHLPAPTMRVGGMPQMVLNASATISNNPAYCMCARASQCVVCVCH